MKYKAMAKWFIYEMAKNASVAPDPEWIGKSFKENGRPLTESELNKFSEALNVELARMEQKLTDQGIIA